MRILVAHNRYQQMGGEDVVFDTESTALQTAGHIVERLVFDNASIRTFYDKVRATANVSHNEGSIRKFRQVLREFRPDVVHIHNFFPLITPGALAATAGDGLPTILTLHNYRALCANSMFFRSGGVCTSCLAGSQLSGVLHRCYRNSAVGSFAIGLMGQNLRRIAHRFPNLITFIALTDFAKSLYVEGGFDENQIVVKANALADPGNGSEARNRRILFVGRLSHEKGVDLICRIAPRIDAEFIIVGGGPEFDNLSRNKPENVNLLGPLPRDQIFDQMRKAAAVVVPSRWYEACPMTVLEAFATGTPIVASRLGSLAELVTDGITGLLAAADDEGEWEHAIGRILSDPELARRMGQTARAAYMERHTEESNLRSLTAIYASAIDRAKGAVISDQVRSDTYMGASIGARRTLS